MAKAKQKASQPDAQARKEAQTAATSIVVAGRYCLRCGRLAMATYLTPADAVPARHVGAALSACCVAQTALLLLPLLSGARDVDMPGSIEGLARVRPPES